MSYLSDDATRAKSQEKMPPSSGAQWFYQLRHVPLNCDVTGVCDVIKPPESPAQMDTVNVVFAIYHTIKPSKVHQ